MGILSNDIEKAGFERVKEVISQRVCQLVQGGREGLRARNIVRMEMACPDIDCVGWLSRQASENKIYWSGRGNEFEMAGVGAADLLKGDGYADYEELFLNLRLGLSSEDKYLRYYGGISFLNKEQDKDWKQFGSYYFVIPRFEIFKAEGKTFFAFNIACDDINSSQINEILAQLNTLNFSNEPFRGNIPRACSLRHYPDRLNWERIFNEDIRLAGKMAFEKIVLARKSAIVFEKDINPLFLFSQIKEQSNNCFYYYFQPSSSAAFLGAAPERLFKRVGGVIESEAVAGTKPRGESRDEDALFQHELLYSDKESLEHRYVADLIRNVLSGYCLSLRAADEGAILKIAATQHLITRFQGTLKKVVSDGRLLSALHPTPAVGGCPREEVLKAISRIEPFERGWYAGPVGFIGPDDVDFAVALRCALVQGENVSLFAGAGVVEGSTAENEWQEIENKISVYTRLFT